MYTFASLYVYKTNTLKGQEKKKLAKTQKYQYEYNKQCIKYKITVCLM